MDRFGLIDFVAFLMNFLVALYKELHCRSIATSPLILLWDEPFGALDAYTRFQMQDLIEFWLEEKRTIVFVTHSVEEAIFLGTKVILMSQDPAK